MRENARKRGRELLQYRGGPEGDSNSGQRRAHKGGNTAEGQKNEAGKGNIKRGRHYAKEKGAGPGWRECYL